MELDYLTSVHWDLFKLPLENTVPYIPTSTTATGFQPITYGYKSEPVPGEPDKIRVRQYTWPDSVPNPVAWREALTIEDIEKFVRSCPDLVSTPVMAAHPHSNCPVCNAEREKPVTIDNELEVLISCMRTSAQDTLVHLHKAGYRIVK
jgi:hypothetical protein